MSGVINEMQEPVNSADPIRAPVGRVVVTLSTSQHNNPIPIIVPCHRVIGSNGTLTGYGGGLELKERLLQLEGAELPASRQLRLM